MGSPGAESLQGGPPPGSGDVASRLIGYLCCAVEPGLTAIAPPRFFGFVMAVSTRLPYTKVRSLTPKVCEVKRRKVVVLKRFFTCRSGRLTLRSARRA